MRRTGSASWRESQNRWCINVQKDGIRKSFYSSTPGRKGQRECNAKADAWLDDGIEDQIIKVNKAFDKYISDLKVTTSKDHWRQYDGYGRNYIIPVIGNVKVINLNEQHLQNVINNAYSSKDKQLSKKTLNNIRACLTQFVKFCRKNNWSKLHPENITIPKSAAPSHKSILQPDQLKVLFTCNNTLLRGKEVPEIYVNAWRFEVITGLRPGEVIGLKWSDIQNDIVHIQRSINRSGEITTGKNDNARRSFALWPLLNKILFLQSNLLNDNNIVSEYVFANEYGDHIPQATYYKRWIRFRDYNNISDNVSPYELRHTFVSIIKSLPPGIVKMLVGHSQNMDTFGIYSHEVIGDIQTAAKLTSEVICSILGDAAIPLK